MYKDYFGFNENPFSIAPNPRYLYMSTMHQEALAHLVYGTTSKGCIVLLTGEVGTGKTTISRYFLEKLPKSTDVAVITNPKLTGTELLASVCDEFEIAVNIEEPTVKNYIDSINGYLLKAYSGNRQAVLIIDEAQNLDLDVLEMLRLLTNLETDEQKLLKIVLLGQSELGSILTRPDLKQINQRITSRYHIKGLKRDDVEAYISHRIMVAGGGRSSFFSTGALNQVVSSSRGIPRLINSICDHSLLGAYSENKERVDKKVVQKAVAEIFGEEDQVDTPKRRNRLILAVCIILIIGAGGIWYGFDSLSKYLLSSETDSPSTQSAQPQQQETEEEAITVEQPDSAILSEPQIIPKLEILPPDFDKLETSDIITEKITEEVEMDPFIDDKKEVQTDGPGEETNISINPIEISE